jgi:hypothetical protein
MLVSPTRGIRRVAAVVAITVGALFALNLGNLVLANRRAEAVEAALATRVAAEEAALTTLETQTAFARTDDYVEKYIRDRRNWAQPGDRVVLPVPAPGSVAGAAPADEAAPPPGFWDRLRRWLGSDEPEAEEEPAP